MRFYLGTSDPHWLWDERLIGIDLFVSAVRLRRKKNLHPALMDWALDSGGFSALSKNGKWGISPHEYVDEVRRYARDIGRMQWAATMDWMCEPHIRELTGLTIEEHQERTAQSYLALRSLAPEITWCPVLQGWGDSPTDIASTNQSYSDHVKMYKDLGVDLSSLPVVGVGSVCRRQNMKVGQSIISSLHFNHGLSNMHGFGFKTSGLREVGALLQSADSLAWSQIARKRKINLGCEHKFCNCCPKWALKWRSEMVLSALSRDKP